MTWFHGGLRALDAIARLGAVFGPPPDETDARFRTHFRAHLDLVESLLRAWIDAGVPLTASQQRFADDVRHILHAAAAAAARTAMDDARFAALDRALRATAEGLEALRNALEDSR